MPSPSQHTIRVLIVDDHPVMRVGLRLLLTSHPSMTLVGEAATCAEAVRLATSEQPDVIVLDLALRRESALDCLPQLRTVAHHTRILILTGFPDPQLQHQAILLGAVGIVSKEEAPEVLLKAIERVQAGEVWLNRTLMARVLDCITRPSEQLDPDAVKIALLTTREREVIALVGQGLRNKLIAERLFISEITVRHHLTAIYYKLGVTDRLELVIYAYKHGLTRPPHSPIPKEHAGGTQMADVSGAIYAVQAPLFRPVTAL